MSVLDEETKHFLFELADRLGWRKSRILEAYELAKKAEILEIKEVDNEVIGIRIKLESQSRRGEFYYVLVGKYGAKCNCEFSTIKKGICKHIAAAIIVWYAVSMIKYGKKINLDELSWLKESEEGM